MPGFYGQNAQPNAGYNANDPLYSRLAQGAVPAPHALQVGSTLPASATPAAQGGARVPWTDTVSRDPNIPANPRGTMANSAPTTPTQPPPTQQGFYGQQGQGGTPSAQGATQQPSQGFYGQQGQGGQQAVHMPGQPMTPGAPNFGLYYAGENGASAKQPGGWGGLTPATGQQKAF